MQFSCNFLFLFFVKENVFLKFMKNVRLKSVAVISAVRFKNTLCHFYFFKRSFEIFTIIIIHVPFEILKWIFVEKYISSKTKLDRLSPDFSILSRNSFNSSNCIGRLWMFKVRTFNPLKFLMFDTKLFSLWYVFLSSMFAKKNRDPYLLDLDNHYNLEN